MFPAVQLLRVEVATCTEKTLAQISCADADSELSSATVDARGNAHSHYFLLKKNKV